MSYGSPDPSIDYLAQLKEAVLFGEVSKIIDLLPKTDESSDWRGILGSDLAQVYKYYGDRGAPDNLLHALIQQRQYSLTRLEMLEAVLAAVKLLTHHPITAEEIDVIEKSIKTNRRYWLKVLRDGSDASSLTSSLSSGSHAPLSRVPSGKSYVSPEALRADSQPRPADALSKTSGSIDPHLSASFPAPTSIKASLSNSEDIPAGQPSPVFPVIVQSSEEPSPKDIPAGQPSVSPLPVQNATPFISLIRHRPATSVSAAITRAVSAPAAGDKEGPLLGREELYAAKYNSPARRGRGDIEGPVSALRDPKRPRLEPIAEASPEH